MRIDIQVSTDVDATEVDFFLRKSDNNLLYVSPMYTKFIGDYLNCKIRYIVATSENEIIGYIPLAFHINLKYGNICNSLPFYGSNGGLMVDKTLENSTKESIYLMLLEKAQELIKDYKCIASTFITNPLDRETGDFFKKNFHYDLMDERIGQITHLPPDSENTEQILINSFQDPRPRNIRKALKSHIKMYYTHNKTDLNFLYDVHCLNISAIGGLPKERRFFNLIPEFFTKKDFRVYIAEKDNEKIAALLLFYYNKTIEYFTPAVVEEYKILQPTALLIYNAMIDGIRMGYRNWNWGGTWLSQDGVYDFKRKWGTTDYPYFYYVKIYDHSILNLSKEELLANYPCFFVVPYNKLSNAPKN